MIRYLIVGCLLAVASPCNAAATERDFAGGVLGRLQATYPEAELRVSSEDPLVIEVKLEGKWTEAKINLHRLHNYCEQATPEECDAALTNFATSILTEPPEPTAADLRLIVRDQEYLDYLLVTMSEDAGPTYRQIGEDLYAFLAFDGPNTISLVLPGDLQTLGLGDAAAWQMAIGQTRAILPALPNGKGLANEAAIFADGEYLASMLADEAWRGVASDAGSDLFVAAISDHFVIAGTMSDGRQLNGLKRMVSDDCAKEERCVSPNVYRYRDGRWVIAD